MSRPSWNSSESVSSGIDSVLEDSEELRLRATFHGQNNEPKPPLPFLLLDNPNDLCWLNTLLNILYKAKHVQNTFFMSSRDSPLYDPLSRIFQGVDKSAEQLRSMLSKTKLHTGPQDAAEVLPSLMNDLKMDFTKNEATFCNCCNTIFLQHDKVECNNDKLTEGHLLTLKRACFLISWNNTSKSIQPTIG